MFMKRIKILFLFIISNLICIGNLFAQSSPLVFDRKTMIPTSPEAAILGRFGEVPIGYYTGTADVSIPLYSIKEANVEIPITLRYHNSGIKVEDQAGWVGLGWSLEPAGTIIQTVYGKEDNLDNITTVDGYAAIKSRMTGGLNVMGVPGVAYPGMFGHTMEIGFNMWNLYPPGCTTDGSGDSHAILNSLTLGNGQPDIYQYNFGRYSGRFYINSETKAVVLIDKKDQISFVNQGGGWLATTLDGDKFYFNQVETATTSVISNRTGYTFKLTSIVFNNGKTINFSYSSGHYEWFVYNETWNSGYPWGFGTYSTSPTVTADISQHNTLTLSTITTDDEVINFNLEARSDINLYSQDNVKRLKSIDITSTNNNKKIKSFNFNYSYFPYSQVGGSFINTSGIVDVLGKRLKLDSLQEVAYTSSGTNTMSTYKFKYDSLVTMPLKTSFARDFYGYYNGQNNSILTPDLSYLYYSIDPYYNNNLSLPFTAANRTPDNTYLTAGMLKRVIYPTGGYTDFDYEPNSFTNYNYPDQNKINSTFKQVSITDANRSTDITSKQFTLSKATIIRFNNIISRGSPLQSPALSYNNMLGSSITLVKVKTSNGLSVTPLKTWDLSTTLSTDFIANNGKQWQEDFKIDYDPDPTTYYVVSVSLPDAIGPQNGPTQTAYVASYFNYYDLSSASQTSNQSGARISAIRNYTQNGTITNKKTLRYVNTDGSSSGILMTPLMYTYNKTMFAANYQSGMELDANMQVQFISSDGYSGGSGNTVGYSRVEEIDLAPDGSTNGKHIYGYYNVPNQTQVNNPDLPYLKNGLITREDVLQASGDTLQENNYVYQNLFPQLVSFNGIKMFSNFVGTYDPNNYACTWANWGNLPLQVPGYVGTSYIGAVGSTYYPHKYEIDFYPINSEWNVLQSKQSKYYDKNHNILSKVDSYTYNSLGQQIKTSSVNSKLQTISNCLLYPVDDTINSSSSTPVLKSQGLYNSLISQRSLVNGNEVSKVQLSYMYNANDPVLKVVNTDIKKSYNQGTPFTEVTFDLYGVNKNLLQFTQKGLTSSVIWSDKNSYKIAEVDNAAYSDVAFTSFETDGSGNWQIPSTVRDTSASVTGIQSYLLSNGSITKANLNSANTYIVSYWSNGGSYTVTGSNNILTGRTISFNGTNWTYYEHTVSNTTTVSISGNGKIDELRLYPKTAQITTYTYKPLIGLNSASDSKSMTTYYEYDDFNRLKIVRDQNGNIIKQYDYHYKQ
jgi:hypothetical protein